MGVLSRLDEIAGQPTATAVPAAPGSFSQGLRQGMTAAGGQLHALAGGVGAALGADDFAANQYAQSQAAQELAATQAPAVSDWRQVTNAPDLSTGLRNAGSYVAGLAGQSVPAIGAGLAGAGVSALSRGAINPLVAGTLAVAPMEVGGALERQQADPEAMKHSAAERLGVAALEGTARAGLMNAVPQIMGGKLLGRAAGSAPGIIAEGVGGNALAGVGAESASTVAENYLNPNRDDSGDKARMLDAAVSGGALGVPFAGVGLAGRALHGAAPKDAAAVAGPAAAVAEPAAAVAAPKNLVDKIKSVFTKDDGVEAAQKIAEGKDVIDVEALKKAAPEQQIEMLRAADAERATTTQSWFDELLKKTSLTDEQRASLMSAASDFGDRANQTIVAGVKLAQDGAAKATQMAEDFHTAMTKKDDGNTIEGGVRDITPQKSEVSAGTRKAIADVVTPHIAARFPQLAESETGMRSITNGLHALMDKMQSTGRVNADAAGHLQKLFGRDLTRVLTDLHDEVLGSGHPDKVDNYFRAVNQLDTNVSSRGKLVDMMRSALPEDARASNDQLDKMVDHLHEYVSGATLEGKTPEQAKAHARVIEAALKDHFGAKADDILEAARVDHEMGREKDAQDTEQARAEGDLPDDHVERADNSDDGFADHVDAGVTTEQDTAKQYFGGGRDKANPQFMLSEQAHRALYGNEDSQHAKVLRRVAAENPDMNVTTVRAREYAREHEIPEARLMEMTKGDPDSHVMVKAEGIKREGLGWQDVERARLDTTKYSDSPSRIDTDAGPILDATKLAKMYAPEHMLARDAHDAVNPMYRLRRQMTEALGALSDHLGENVEPDDHTVVAYRRGKPVTWKEVQEQGRVKPDERARAMSELYSEREAAVKAGDMDHVATLDADIEKRTGFDDHEAPKNEGSAKLAFAARDLGAAHDKLVAEFAKGKPRDGRAPTMRENILMREYREAVKRYEQAEQRLHEQRTGGELHSAAEDGTRMTRKAGDGEGDIQSHTNMESASWGGATEMAPDGQVHLADAQHGDKLGGVFKAGRNMEAGPEGNLLHASNFEPDTHFDGRLPTDVKSAIAGRVQQFVIGKSAAARAVGEKGQHLLSVIDQMRKYDAAELASVVKEKSGAERASTINSLYARYKDLKAPEPMKGGFVERVVGSGNIDAVVKSIVKSSDTKALQRAIDALAPHQHDASARKVMEVANERLGKLVEANPDVAYSMQRVDPQARATSKVQGDVRAHIEQVLGKSVDVEFAKLLHAGEFVTDRARIPQGLNADVIRISTHSLDPMSVGYHESLHAFMAKLHDAGLMDSAHPLEKAANTPSVLRQLRTLLAGEPDALAQLSSSSERVAYMYQFWAAGQLHLDGRPAGIMGHVADFFRRTLGIWTNDERAEHIMQYFHSGEYGRNMRDRSAVARALDQGTNGAVEKFKAMVTPLARLADAVVSTGDARLRSTGVDALAKLADKVYAPLHGEHGADPGYIPASRAKRGEFMNQLATELGRHDAGTITDALESMQRGLRRGATPAETSAIAAIRKTLDTTFTYMREAGVNIQALGFGHDYFPRVWDTNAILRNEAGFRDMLQHYVTSGQFKGSVDQVIATLTRSEGADLQAPTIKPGMQASKERVLHFISGQDAAPFLNKNLYETLNSYITQATRRAEWARRFGDDNASLHGLISDAQKQGATAEHLKMATDYLQGVDGTLGDRIDPKLRRAFGNMIVYQNLRLLPLALFSSMIDPMGILVRGGTVGESFAAMKRGFAEIPKGFEKNATHDEWTQLAATMGVIDHAVLQHNLGTSFSQGMTSSMGRKLNDTFFKYNLMEQYNASMRVAATQAAVGFLARHADGAASPHSQRWLAELGFKPGDIQVANGRPLLHAHEFEAAGMAPDAAARAADRMTLAVNKWVDGAILRPNAAHKPVWMNDPHFAVVAHLKQFVYSFQETILKRVANEVRFGNVGPAYALAAYVPFMLAADTVKGMVQGGGDQPDWKKGWDASDYAFYEVQRAGLFGVGQFGVDAAKDLHRGGLGIGALAGPTLEQLGDAVKTVAGTEQFKTFALNALPANALFDAAGAATASTNAVD